MQTLFRATGRQAAIVRLPVVADAAVRADQVPESSSEISMHCIAVKKGGKDNDRV